MFCNLDSDYIETTGTMTQEYLVVCFVSAAQCHGEQENGHFLHGGEEDRGQRGEAADKRVQYLPLR